MASIKINSGTIVARVDGGKLATVKLVGDVYVEAARDEDGCWVYGVDGDTYCCAGGLATVL